MEITSKLVNPINLTININKKYRLTIELMSNRGAIIESDRQEKYIRQGTKSSIVMERKKK